MKLAFTTLTLVAALAERRPVSAAPSLNPSDRRLDLSAGYTLSAPFEEFLPPMPGFRLQSRWFPNRFWHVGPLAAYELGINHGNPEKLRAFSVLGLGLAGGVHLDLWQALTLSGDARVEWLQAWDLPTANRRRNTHDGLRLGPEAALSLWFGKAWGHPLCLEARFAYLLRWLDLGNDGAAGGWQAGLGISGVLLPEPE
jgi:hypothetical protein